MGATNGEMWWGKDSGSGKFYHGSLQKFEVGQYITPPKARKTRGRTAKFDVPGYNPERVYITPHYDIAANFTHLEGGKGDHVGYMYEVEPVGKMERDTDGDLSRAAFGVDAARVVRVIKGGDPISGSPGNNGRAYANGADKPENAEAPNNAHYPNTYAGKCAKCGQRVGEKEGVMVRTLLPKPAKQWETYHSEHLGK